MSEGAPEVVDLGFTGDSAFSSLMDALAPEPADPAGGQGAGEAGAPAGADGAAAAAGGQPGAPAAGADGAAAAAPGDDPAVPGGDGSDAAAGQPPAADGQGTDAAEPAAGGGADLPAAWTASAADVAPKLGELSTALEERTTQAYQAEALEAVKTEHAQYFTALEKHPRLLIGQQVPAIGKEGTETLRDADDARDWQDAVRSLLVAEVRSRASKAMDENSGFLQTVHASIALFQDNPDLVPGTKDFDTELANRFSTLAEPYELRVEGKLQGYSIPVQPIVTQLRAQIAQERAAAASQAAATGAPAPLSASGAPVPPASAQAEPPQAGIASKAGSGAAGAEDFSTLFGTIHSSLANLTI